MKRLDLLVLLGVIAIINGCVKDSEQPTSDAVEELDTYYDSSDQQKLEISEEDNDYYSEEGMSEDLTWKMHPVWNIQTGGIPFMDLSPDGRLSGVIDWNAHRLYLVKPTGESVSFDLQGTDSVQPVVAGIVIKENAAYVFADYESFAGIRTYSWKGMVDQLKTGSSADGIMRSPNGSHICYLTTLSPTEQQLSCDGKDIKLENAYSLKWVSDSGLVITEAKGKSVVFREGSKVVTIDSKNVLAYGDKLIVNDNNNLKITSLAGEVLASKENAGFTQTVLLRWTLIPTGKYIFRHEALEDTQVFTWNLKEVKVLPGFPYFANENFVVTAKDGVIHCYSLGDLHEVFSLKVPGDSLGYIKLSNDGKIMLISGETGGFWLYTAD